MTKVDLTPLSMTKPIEPITFFNHIEEVVITEEDIKILRDVQRLSSYATPECIISLKILKIRIIKNSHKVGLKLAKDIVEYLDATLLKG